MYLYVYKVEDTTNGEYYIGSRKSVKEPLVDTYMGSPNVWKPNKLNLTKTILKEGFNSIEEMIDYEAELIKANINNPLNQNYRIPNSKFYNKNGKCGKSNGAYGMKWITNGTETKFVKKSDIELYLQNGWKLGHNRKTGFTTKGRKWITNGLQNKFVYDNEISKFNLLNTGWYYGKTYTEESLLKIKQSSLDSAEKYKKRNSERMKKIMIDTVWMNDGIKNYRVKVTVVVEKIKIGWKNGRTNYTPHNKKK